MRIIEYSIKNLKSQLSSDEFWSSNIVPISKHKIISHINNPRANEEDIVLLVAYNDNDEIISYLGALPDKLNIDDNEIKFAWLSCWWTNQNPINSKYSIILLLRMLKLYNNNIGISDFTERAKEIYDATGKFFNYKVFEEHKYFIRFCTEKNLPKSMILFTKYKKILKFIDFISNIFNDFRLVFKRKKFQKKIDCQIYEINNPDIETQQFLSNFNLYDLNPRGKSELEWIMNYPWIINTKKDSEIARKYYFLSEAREFRFFSLKIKMKNNTLAFLIFRLRDKELKLLYDFFNQEDIETICLIIINILLKNKVNLFSCKNNLINDNLLKLKIPFIYHRKNKKYLYLSKNLESKLNKNLNLHDGDGDNAFT